MWSTLIIVMVVMGVVMPALNRGGWDWGRRRRRFRAGWDDGDGSSQMLAELRQDAANRDADMEALNTRVAELENRLDFTERMLASQREQAALVERNTPPR